MRGELIRKIRKGKLKAMAKHNSSPLTTLNSVSSVLWLVLAGPSLFVCQGYSPKAYLYHDTASSIMFEQALSCYQKHPVSIP